MKKRDERELFFKLVYMINFYPKEELDEAVVTFLTESGVVDTEIFLSRIHMLYDNIKTIDETIDSLSKGWKSSRIAKVELSLLRMAVFEMQHENQTKAIAINEAVELAKTYGSERSYAFVNGILSNVE